MTEKIYVLKENKDGSGAIQEIIQKCFRITFEGKHFYLDGNQSYEFHQLNEFNKIANKCYNSYKAYLDSYYEICKQTKREFDQEEIDETNDKLMQLQEEFKRVEFEKINDKQLKMSWRYEHDWREELEENIILPKTILKNGKRP